MQLPDYAKEQQVLWGGKVTVERLQEGEEYSIPGRNGRGKDRRRVGSGEVILKIMATPAGLAKFESALEREKRRGERGAIVGGYD